MVWWTWLLRYKVLMDILMLLMLLSWMRRLLLRRWWWPLLRVVDLLWIRITSGVLMWLRRRHEVLVNVIRRLLRWS